MSKPVPAIPEGAEWAFPKARGIPSSDPAQCGLLGAANIHASLRVSPGESSASPLTLSKRLPALPPSVGDNDSDGDGDDEQQSNITAWPPRSQERGDTSARMPSATPTSSTGLAYPRVLGWSLKEHIGGGGFSK